ncbi:hypothetical protein L1887_19710 [Cichorium endivia]|nr:hypothetical protein L1887_19710 [Cichorium endivia]
MDGCSRPPENSGILILKAIRIRCCDSIKIFHQIRGNFLLFPIRSASRNSNFCVGGFLGFSNKRKHLACIAHNP